MKLNPEALSKLETLTLAYGQHESPDAGMCAMEAVAFVAGEPFSDHPQCASPVLGAFMRSWNDGLSDRDRTRLLKPYVLKLVGTRGTPEEEEARAWMACDWLVRVQTPAWLELAGLKAHADVLRQLAPLVSAETAKAAQGDINAARDAAWVAARVAAGDAAWVAARVAARVAAGDAARVAARVAAGDAARVAAGDAAWVAARDAARGKLSPTVELLQRSACDLLDAMIAVTASPDSGTPGGSSHG